MDFTIHGFDLANNRVSVTYHTPDGDRLNNIEDLANEDGTLVNLTDGAAVLAALRRFAKHYESDDRWAPEHLIGVRQRGG